MTAAGPVIRRLSAFATLTPETLRILDGLGPLQAFAAGTEVVADEDELKPTFLISGWAARVRWLADGRRQIVSLVLPGEGLGVCERPEPLALCPVIAVTGITLAHADAVKRLAFESDGPNGSDLRIALKLSAALDEAGLIDQVVRLGRQTALERISHLFLELRFRLSLTDMVRDDAFDLPLTQEQLADVLGLSTVHVNRTLQQLRTEEAVEFRNGRLRLLRPALLEGLTDYVAPVVSRWTPAIAPRRT
jgi:CRP-like cAMP-binding protein